MKYVWQVIGFLIVSVLVQFLFWVSKIKVLEELNVFDQSACWVWLGGAAIVFLVLSVMTDRCHKSIARWGMGIAAVASLVVLGWFLPSVVFLHRGINNATPRPRNRQY